MRYWIRFKGHRNSTRVYTLESAEPGAMHFVKACLEAQGWLVLEAGPKP
jgi:hypothetical protein